MEKIVLREEFIKLGQALKAVGFVEDGVEAKIEITKGNVLVNGEVDTRRGRKLYAGDIVSFKGKEKILCLCHLPERITSLVPCFPELRQEPVLLPESLSSCPFGANDLVSPCSIIRIKTYLHLYIL